ncbi:MAG: sigma-70 family RNA polymerase sigma factor [Verrucomicrobiae bacterium]|nr:sigma-70 family RNA polymerase sigma factor [Verrucomicrobiae bacterium]
MSATPRTAPQPGDFRTTRWSRVRHAKCDSEEGKIALAELCEAYYEPVVVFLRYELRDPDKARETAHAFFAEMLAGRAIGGADRERGRFRSYLLGALKHFLLNERAAQHRLKRGGGAEHLDLDETGARSISDERQIPPDLAYDRQWATTLLGHALDALRAEYAARGRSEFFDRLKPWLTGEAEHGEQQALAASLGMNLNTLKSDISRLKLRFQALVREEIAGTVDGDDEAREELAILFAALRNS